MWFRILIMIFAIWLVWTISLLLFTRFEREIVVKNKEGYGTRNGRSQLVTDQEGRIYSVSNNIFLWHFTSAEVFGKMEVGKRYKIKGYGVRIPVLGMFPNIVRID
jgi:hypothetical protein